MVNLAIVTVYLYFMGLCTWVLLNACCGDRWWWLFLLNSFALYLFLPLPALLCVAYVSQRFDLRVATAAAALLGVYLYGGLFTPRYPQVYASDQTLTVMTYNLLGFNFRREQIIDTIRTAQADVVALQELNFAVAAAVRDQLKELYPYQVLEPQSGVRGLGVISRYELQPTGQVFAGAWLGTPQILTLDYQGAQVTVVNFHSVSVPLDKWQDRTRFEESIRERERQAETLATFAASQAGPLIVMGDFNTTDQSTAYRLVTNSLRDAWRAVGYGFGHTFPGADSPGSARLTIGNFKVPMWLIRIDYIFHSAHWRPLTAWIGPWDGISDHRPVIARLVLTDQ